MLEEENILKLCHLSRLVVPESEIKKTSIKIKEVITLFDKLDEFNIDDESDNFKLNFTKETAVEELHDDVPTNELNSQEDAKESKNFSFNFLNTKNRFVLGPRI